MRGASSPLVKAWGVAADASRRRGAEWESGLCIHAASMIRRGPSWLCPAGSTRPGAAIVQMQQKAKNDVLETFSRPVLAHFYLHLHMHLAVRLDVAVKTQVGVNIHQEQLEATGHTAALRGCCRCRSPFKDLVKVPGCQLLNSTTRRRDAECISVRAVHENLRIRALSRPLTLCRSIWSWLSILLLPRPVEGNEWPTSLCRTRSATWYLTVRQSTPYADLPSWDSSTLLISHVVVHTPVLT